MREAVRNIARLFPASIVSGRSREKVQQATTPYFSLMLAYFSIYIMSAVIIKLVRSEVKLISTDFPQDVPCQNPIYIAFSQVVISVVLHYLDFKSKEISCLLEN